jgi:methyl-accepting chemotaxis protein
VTQQNAAMVEETTAASRTLFEESTKLSGLIGQFRVAGAEEDEAAPRAARAKGEAKSIAA